LEKIEGVRIRENAVESKNYSVEDHKKKHEVLHKFGADEVFDEFM
jgi:hypothetical protein